MNVHQIIPSDRAVPRHQALLFLIGAALLWSSGGLLIKMVVWHPLAIAGMRSAIAAVFMIIWRRGVRFNWSPAQIYGALAYAATVILFVIANKMTIAANAILLQYTAPVYTAILAVLLLKERTSRLDWITISIVIGGMALFFLDRLSFRGLWGNACAILSGVAFASEAVFLRMQKDGSPLESIILGNILAALIGLPFMFGSAPDASGWLGLVLLGLFQLGVSYILYATAIKSVTALEAIIIPIIEPILNPIWVFLVFQEQPGRWAFLGGTIVLITVTVRCILVALKENHSKSVNPSNRGSYDS